MKRLVLSSALVGLGVATALLRRRGRTGSSWLTVLTYHRAGPPPSIARIDDNLIAASPEGLRRQVAFCMEWFDVVGLDDVLAFLRGAPLPPAPLLLTFDDGYKDNVDVALPILRDLGARAVFFVATSYVGERRLFWWDRIHYVIKASRRDAIELAYPYPVTLRIGTARERDAAIAAALRLVKESYALDLRRFLDGLEGAAGGALDGETERRLVDEHVVTWDDVRALRRAGMDVQSHTHEHRVLHTMETGALARDLATSRRTLEDVLGEPIRAVAYPVGKAAGYPARIREAVRDAGYELGFSNRSGVNPIDAFDPFDAKRISIDRSFTDDYFASVMALPSLAYAGKR